ncbi:Alpha subunit of the F1 sector of mitochondrial F1F0 ATP synthase [Rhizophlyctis rosea]|nr:Alpha subunit of the F1 sector of mitochondrial F1F0 ATP synthase [Rhizophlyctis rosea]
MKPLPTVKCLSLSVVPRVVRPSRNGDDLYLHSYLPVRAAKLNKNFGGGSMAALPVIEIRGGDVSAYIPTNVISIPTVKPSCVRPANNARLSVPRVGSAAQGHESSRSYLEAFLGQYCEVAAFAYVGSDFGCLHTVQPQPGARLTELLKQTQYNALPVEHMVVIVYCGVNGFLNDSRQQGYPI